MSEELNAQVTKLTEQFLSSLKGKAKEFYESRQDIKDRTASTAKAMAEITLRLAVEKDEQRRASLKESLDTGLDTYENDVAAILQGTVNEGSTWLLEQLHVIAAFGKEALPVVLSWALKAAQG